jgi:hypothetical protein
MSVPEEIRTVYTPGFVARSSESPWYITRDLTA